MADVDTTVGKRGDTTVVDATTWTNGYMTT